MNPPAQPFIGVLPAACPEHNCGTMLQVKWDNPDVGVEPHYSTCHPGVLAPAVVHP